MANCNGGRWISRIGQGLGGTIRVERTKRGDDGFTRVSSIEVEEL